MNRTWHSSACKVIDGSQRDSDKITHKDCKYCRKSCWEHTVDDVDIQISIFLFATFNNFCLLCLFLQTFFNVFFSTNKKVEKFWILTLQSLKIQYYFSLIKWTICVVCEKVARTAQVNGLRPVPILTADSISLRKNIWPVVNLCNIDAIRPFLKPLFEFALRYLRKSNNVHLM